MESSRTRVRSPVRRSLRANRPHHSALSLAAFISVAGWALVTTLSDVMRTTYESWTDPTVGVPGQWDLPEPAGE